MEYPINAEIAASNATSITCGIEMLQRVKPELTAFVTPPITPDDVVMTEV